MPTLEDTAPPLKAQWRQVLLFESKTFRFVHSPMWFILFLVLNGCVSLPDLNTLRNGTQARQRHTKLLSAELSLPKNQMQEISRNLPATSKRSPLQRHLSFLEALNGPPLIANNSVHLLVDGPATFAAMFATISRARKHINLESYIIDDGAIGQQLADLLIEKRQQGVQINIIYDSVGSISTPIEFFDRLKANRINVCEFNPVNPKKGRAWRINNRDHRKMLLVDGEIAFTGGINISGVYSTGSAGGGKNKLNNNRGWRDTYVQITGPVVAQFQHHFYQTWTRQCGTPLLPCNYFPALSVEGDKVIRVIASSPDDALNLTYVALLSAIDQAEKRVYLTMGYFVPDPQTIATLCAAARRGVDVKLLLPGFSDFPLVFHAGRSHYSELLRSGVKIFERRDAMLHAKTAVIDGVWSSIGSTNMDWRSFLHNDEVNAVVLGEDFATEMERMFEQDLKSAVEVDTTQWEARGPTMRFKEWGARIWEYWL